MGSAAGGDLKTIVFVGDSITAGVGVKNPETSRYSSQTIALLKPSLPEVTGITLGKSAQALCQQPPSYPSEILQHSPDAVVIQWGVNDLYWGYSVTEFARAYDRLVSALREATPELQIIVATLVADFRREDDLDLWIGRSNVAIQEIAMRHGCKVAYVHRAIDHDRSLYADAIHPNEAGAAAIARAITTAIQTAPAPIAQPAVQFDRGSEVRFLRYLFRQTLEENSPQWTRVSEITRGGMDIETRSPLTVRTPAIYEQNTSYTITTRASDDRVIATTKASTIWNRMLEFTIAPSPSEATLTIEISITE